MEKDTEGKVEIHNTVLHPGDIEIIGTEIELRGPITIEEGCTVKILPVNPRP